MFSGDERTYRTWAEIDPTALSHNVACVSRRSGPGARMLAVVKSDAYGHGLVPVAAAVGDRVDFFGVASVQEAQMLGGVFQNREKTPPILLLGPALEVELPLCLRQGWHLSISTADELETVARTARRLGVPAVVHLIVDTGMGRLGALEGAFEALCRSAVAASPAIRVAGLASHLPSADEDPGFTREQIHRFEKLLAPVYPLFAPERPLVHVHNSAGLLGYPAIEAYPCLMRPGLALYGVSPCADLQGELREVMQWKTRVRLVRELPAGHGISYGRTYVTARPTRVATLGIGYGDGYRRSLSGTGACVLVRGRRCPLLGRVTMDQIMVDVTDSGRVEAGEVAVLFGEQDGARISIREVAEWAGTIPWEVMTGITSRVPRIYFDEAGGERKLKSVGIRAGHGA